MTERGLENTTYLGGFTNRDWQIVLSVTVDTETSLRNNDLRLRMVLGVQREDACRADDEMIEIGTLLIEDDVVEDQPIRLIQLGEPTTDSFLSDCAHSVRPLVGMDL
jgi:hypothetical protein